MIKIIFLSALLTQSLISSSQYSKKLFEKSTWVCDNADSSFFRKDTIMLLRVNGSEDLANYFHNDNYITLEFMDNGRMRLSNTLTREWVVDVKKGKYSWGFNSKEKSLQIFFNSKRLVTFVPIYEDSIAVKSKFANRTLIKTRVITLKRLR